MSVGCRSAPARCRLSPRFLSPILARGRRLGSIERCALQFQCDVGEFEHGLQNFPGLISGVLRLAECGLTGGDDMGG